MAEHGERSPLLQASRDSNWRKTEERSGLTEGGSRCLPTRQRAINTSKQRLRLCHNSWHALTMVAVLLTTVTGFLSYGLFSLVTPDNSRVSEGDTEVTQRLIPPSIEVSVPRHEIQFDRDDGHDFGDFKSYGDRERSNRGSTQEVQPQALEHHDLNAVEHADGTGNAYVNPVSQPDLTLEGQGQDSIDDGGGGRNASKPNVFVFLIDDMGWNDIGYQSTDLSAYSPRLDALAAEGVKLRNYYSMQVCTPARASLMTGRYPLRYGMQYSVVLAGAPWGMPLSEKIMPQYFNDAGYDSHMVGKWHLGMYQKEHMPQMRGFDTYLGYLGGSDDYWAHQTTDIVLKDGTKFFDFGWGNSTGYYDVTPWNAGAAKGGVSDATEMDVPRHSPAVPPYAPSYSSRAAIGTAQEDKREAQNTNLAEIAPRPDEASPGATQGVQEFSGKAHGTGHGSGTMRPARQWDEPEVIDEGAAVYNGVYSEDIYLGRATRIIESKTPWDEKPLFLYVAHQAVHAPISKVPGDAFSEEEQEILDQLKSTTNKREAFARVLFYLDKKIGQFVDTLESRGWLKNSIIVVASDNGGCPHDGSTNYPNRGYKESYFEGGIKVPAFVYSKSHLPQEVWGSTYDGLVHVTDWLPTLASATGMGLSGSAGPLDGVDHWSAFTGQRVEETPVRDSILHGFDSYKILSKHVLTRDDSLAQGAFREGKWKLITNEWCTGYTSFDLRVQEDPLLNSSNVCRGDGTCHCCVDDCRGNTKYKFHDWLYDIESDPRETTNLIDEYPEVARQMRERAKEIALREFEPSLCKSVDKGSYLFWKSHGYWVLPWLPSNATRR